jgi:hypothetical protein
MKQFTMKQIENMHVSKGELFQTLKNEGTEFDYALPQDWLNDLADYCRVYFPSVTRDLITSTTIWVYASQGFTFGDAYTACTEVQRAIDAMDNEAHVRGLFRVMGNK